MPIYEFNCAKCGKPTEVMQKLGARPPPCPHCGSKRMSRAVSKTSFALKGGGWYADLYATPKPGEKKPEGGEAPAAAADKPETPAKPGESAKPGEPPKPGESARSGEAAKPSETARPGGAAKPGESVKPAAAPKEAASRPASSPPGRRTPSPRKRR